MGRDNMKIDEYFMKLNSVVEDFDSVFIYGAGRKGTALLSLLTENHIKVDGFVVSSGDENKLEEAGLKIIDIHSLDRENDSCLFLIGVRSRWNEAVKETLVSEGYTHFIDAPDRIEYIGNKDLDRSERNVLQITTQIGCRINCTYCPQNVFITEYKKHSNIYSMSLDLFRKCIDNTSRDTIIQFAGFSEPFFNIECINMIKYVAEKGYDIELFTTLEGLSVDGFNKIKDYPYRENVLHIPDEENHSKICVNEEYMMLLETVLRAKKLNGSPFIDWISCHGHVDKRVKPYLCSSFRIITQMHDRAGNVNGLGLEKVKNRVEGKIWCSGAKRLNHNVLLPDGTVLLCDSDWGMKHVIGNLLEQTYKDILDGKMLNDIRNSMVNDGDIICRNCCYAVESKGQSK